MISLKTKLDREIQSSHKVTVQAGYLTKAIFTIYVDDVNDNPPELKNKDLEVILCIGNNEERQILYPSIEMVDKDDDKTGGKPFHFYPTKSTFQSKNFEIIDNGGKKILNSREFISDNHAFVFSRQHSIFTNKAH